MKHGKLEGRHTSFASINFVFCVGGAKTFFIKASATWKIGVNKSKLDPFPNPSFFNGKGSSKPYQEDQDHEYPPC
jgi:hypothetical protein